MQNTDLHNLLWDMGKALISDLNAALEPIFRESGLTMTQLRVLCEISAREPVSVGMLTHIAGENKGNCSSLCKKLEAAGYLTRSRCPTDERRVELQLTRQGHELLQRISDEAERKYALISAEISPEEMTVILNSMNRLIQVFNKISQGKETL